MRIIEGTVRCDHTIVTTPNLFDPIRVGDLDLPNRILMSAMTRLRATTDNIPTPLMVEHYTQRASAGLIISEGTVVSPMGVGYAQVPGIWSQQQIEAWKPVTASVHARGGRIFQQLWHVGRISDPMFLTKVRYSNCSRGYPHLLAEPCVRRFLVQARVPRHEIWEWLDFSRRFYQAYAIDSPDKLCQLSRHSQDQVRFRNCEHGCRKEWNAEDNTPLRTKLSQRTVHGSLFARPGLDHHMGKLYILGQRKTRGSNSLSGPHHADKIDFEKNLTLQGGRRMLRAERCVQLPLDHSFVGSILPLGHFQSYLGRSAAYSPDEGRYQRYRCMVRYR
jgi:hypothetical protein